MSNWQPIEDAPMDGTRILSVWDGVPVFIAYGSVLHTSYKYQSIWDRLFGKITKTETTSDRAWRVLSWGPRLGWTWNGNCEEYSPTIWTPIPMPENIK